MVGEDVDEFNPTDHAPMMRTLREKIIRWVEDNLEAIRDCRPELDRNLYQNRQRENILTLLQIADVVGGGWGERARDALTNLTARDKPIDENELLIGDIAEILLDPEIMVGDPPKGIGEGNVVFSSDLWNLLRERFSHRLLYETNFTQAKMASMLSTFEIEPQRVGKRRGKHVLRWYLRSDFDNAIARYAPEIAAALLQTEEVPRSSVADNPEPQGVSTAATEPPALEAVMAAPVAEGSTSSAGATPLQAAPLERVESATAPGDAVSSPTGAPAIAYPNARVVAVGLGEKKRLKRLHREVEALVLAGTVDPANVAYITSRFWVISRDGQPCYVHMDGGNLEWLAIAEPGLLVDRDTGTVRINSKEVLSFADSDFMVLRPLVNKYRKMSVQ
jgi:hypothetical protein